MTISRLSYESMNVMDVGTAMWHYLHVDGLREADRDADGHVYLQAADTQDHQCVILNPARTVGVEHPGFKVSDSVDLDEAAAVTAYGLLVTRVPAGTAKGQGAQRCQYAERTDINAPMQGTAADLIKLAMIRIDRWLHDNGEAGAHDHAGAR